MDHKAYEKYRAEQPVLAPQPPLFDFADDHYTWAEVTVVTTVVVGIILALWLLGKILFKDKEPKQ
jgi:hypothetical protein